CALRMPWALSNFTTAMARAADSSQLDGKAAVLIGLLSVWASTCSTQLMSLGIFELISIRGLGTLGRCFSPLDCSAADPDGNSTSDWNTKRSPTICTSRWP